MSDIWLKVQLDKIEGKIDKLDSRLDNVDITLAKQSVVLEDHTRRSLANETQVDILKKKLDYELKPLKNHVNVVHGVFKIIGVVASGMGIISGFLKVLEYLHK